MFFNLKKRKPCLHPFLGQEKTYDFTPGRASITTVCGLCGETFNIDTSAQDGVNLRYNKSPYQASSEGLFSNHPLPTC